MNVKKKEQHNPSLQNQTKYKTCVLELLDIFLDMKYAFKKLNFIDH